MTRKEEKVNEHKESENATTSRRTTKEENEQKGIDAQEGDDLKEAKNTQE